MLHSNSLKLQSLFKKKKENVLVVVKEKKTTTTKTLFCWIVMFIAALLWLLETSNSKIAGPPKKRRNLKPSIHGEINRGGRGEGRKQFEGVRGATFRPLTYADAASMKSFWRAFRPPSLFFCRSLLRSHDLTL